MKTSNGIWLLSLLHHKNVCEAQETVLTTYSSLLINKFSEHNKQFNNMDSINALSVFLYCLIMVSCKGVIMWQTHQYIHSLQSRRFLGHTGHTVDPSRWVYNDTDLPPSHTHHWGSPEGRTDRLDTTDTNKRQERKYQPIIII